MVGTLEARDKKLSEISRQEHLKRSGGARQHVLAFFPRQRLRLVFRLAAQVRTRGVFGVLCCVDCF